FDPDASSVQSLFNPPGTKDLPVRTGIGSALNFINKIGIKNIERRCRSLSNYLKNGLKKIDGVTLLSGKTPNLSAPGSTIFEKKNLDAVDSVTLFEKRIKYHIDEHQRDGHNAIRISTHFYNSKEQIDLLLNELSII
ncbi:MAG: aminotransferase class V-fold PLP-dependent enzyme, partial [Candidatus Neomarinimicrobiota bacterium]|nr:aminotransferase class V-fold PLP-dependent enzyme [Candidatus Neomarinimicrobiota bacterium]